MYMYTHMHISYLAHCLLYQLGLINKLTGNLQVVARNSN